MMNEPNNERGWYAAAVEPQPVRKKKKRWIFPLVLLGVLLCIALLAGLAFRTSSDYGISDGDDYAGEDYPGNWHDYFDQYFNSNSIDSGTASVDIKSTDYTGDFHMTLDSASAAAVPLTELYQKCIPSVVSIEGTASGKQNIYFGTGIVLSSDGLIVTNTHIIKDCDKATVTTQDGTEYSAALIGADNISDISVLKIEADGLTPASFADSSQLQVGSDCVAIGNPVSRKLTGTMTNGIISAIDRNITSNGHSMTLIQTNAAINEGNSGGPLLDMSGRVIGITNMKAMSSVSTVEGIGFAIPSAIVSEVVTQLLENGQVTGRPSIGIIVSPVGEDLSSQYDIPQGLYISAVNKGSDAEKQGVKAGDILTAVNGTPITTNEEVTAIKNTMQAGDSIHLTVWRDGTTLEFDVTLTEASSLN